MIMRYTFNVADNKIVCVSHFAGKAVRGIAKCDPNCDEFNEETGKKLSQKRCDVKVSQKRLKRVNERLNEAINQLTEAKAIVDKLTCYRHDAVIQLNRDVDALAVLEDSLK